MAGKNHHPAVGQLIAEHLRVAEIGYIAAEYRITLILGEGLSSVKTVSDRLVLTAHFGLGIDSHQRALTKSGCVLAVDHA